MLKSELEVATSKTRAMPGLPFQGCINRDALILKLQPRSDELAATLAESAAERHKHKAEYADQTSQLAHDFDRS